MSTFLKKCPKIHSSKTCHNRHRASCPANFLTLDCFPRVSISLDFMIRWVFYPDVLEDEWHWLEIVDGPPVDCSNLLLFIFLSILDIHMIYQFVNSIISSLLVHVFDWNKSQNVQIGRKIPFMFITTLLNLIWSKNPTYNIGRYHMLTRFWTK